MIHNNKKPLSTGFSVGSQSPIDDRLVFDSIAELIDLGVDDVNAYRYYKGMKVIVLSIDREYIWKPSASGELPTSFTYPAGHIQNGVNYGGIAYNFVEYSVSGGLGNLIRWTRDDKNLTAPITSGDNFATGLTISNDPVNDGYVMVTVDNQRANLTGDKLGDCYFSIDGGTTAKAIDQIQAGDQFIWNGNIAGVDLDTSDRINFDYLVQI